MEAPPLLNEHKTYILQEILKYTPDQILNLEKN